MTLVLILGVALGAVVIAAVLARCLPLRALRPTPATPPWRRRVALIIASLLVLVVVLTTLLSSVGTTMAPAVPATILPPLAVKGSAAEAEAWATAPTFVERLAIVHWRQGVGRVIAYTEQRCPRQHLADLACTLPADNPILPGHRLQATLSGLRPPRQAPGHGWVVDGVYEAGYTETVRIGWWQLGNGGTSLTSTLQLGASPQTALLANLQDRVETAPALSVVCAPMGGIVAMAVAIAPVPTGTELTTATLDEHALLGLFPGLGLPRDVNSVTMVAALPPGNPATDLLVHLRLAAIFLGLAVYLVGYGARHPQLTRCAGALVAIALAVVLEQIVVHRDAVLAADAAQPFEVRLAARDQAADAFFQPAALPMPSAPLVPASVGTGTGHPLP